MAKRSKQRPARQNKDQSGCMWGIISMFDFRHGRATRRLLSDRRRYTDNDIRGSTYPTSDPNLPTNSQEMNPSIEDGGKMRRSTIDLTSTRVKELIEEEMIIEQNPKPVRKDHEQKNKSKTLKKPFTEEISVSHQVSTQKASQYHDLEALVKEILLIYKKKNEQHGILDTGAKGSFPTVEEKVIMAVEALLKDKSENGDCKKVHGSKEMIQMLSSNKEMFLKILQDQQSSILLNEDPKSKSKSNPKSTEQGLEEPLIRKQRKFFRRRSKSHESIPMNEKGRIVILKSGSSENRVPEESETHSEGNGSQFSFMEIKRRLKHAMGKERPLLVPERPGPTEKTGKTFLDGGWSSPNRNHFYTERFARLSKSRESETESENENVNHRISNIYVEAKKHLSEMLTSGDEDAESMMRSLPKSLGRILSFREYNSFSPITSPRVRSRHMSCEDLFMANKSQLFTTIDYPEKKSVVPDDMTCQGVQEIVKSTSGDEETKEQTEASEPRDSPNKDRSSDIVELELHEQELFSSQNLKEPSVDFANKISEHKISPGKPSPVSVLEPLFSDDDISPAKTVSLPVEAAVQPLRIQFDEAVSSSESQQIRITDSGDDEESPFEYVEAVLLSSDLNWSEFETRWISSAQILDLSLFHDVEMFSSRAKHDQRLLFDATNAALEEVCNRFIPESSFIKPNVCPVPKGMDLIKEVWSRLESRLCKPYPRELSKLVRNDLETSKTWLDLRSESCEIVNKTEESIFDEIIDDTLSSLFDDGEISDDGMDNSLCSS